MCEDSVTELKKLRILSNGWTKMTELSFPSICILAISQHATDFLAKRIEWSERIENNMGEIGNFIGGEEAIRKFTTVKVSTVPQRGEQGE